MQHGQVAKCSRFKPTLRVRDPFPYPLFVYYKKGVAEKGEGCRGRATVSLCLLIVTTNKLLHGFLTNPLDCSPFFYWFLTSFLLHPLLRPTFPCISSHALASQNPSYLALMGIFLWVKGIFFCCVVGKEFRESSYAGDLHE